MASKRKILSKTTKRGNFKLVGAYLPLPFTQYLSLYVTVKGLSKSDIIVPKLYEWEQFMKKDNSEEFLTEQLSIAINQKVLFEKKKKREKFDIEKFKKALIVELNGKGISEKVINTVIAKIK